MNVFIEWPSLALAPAFVFVVLSRAGRRTSSVVAALMWTGYAFYEYAMQRRWLCTGECNIRVDLLLLYPVLFGISVLAAVAAVRGMMRRRGNPR